jgi:hypothetical protein
MKHPYTIRKGAIVTLLFLLFLALDGLSQTLMPIPSQSTSYTGNTRGYWFQAPTDFRIVGLRVPTDASTDDQSVAVVRFNAGAPPFYATTTNNFTVLALFQDIAGSNVLSVNIPVYEDDYIGIIGSRGATSTNSYGANNFSTNILGESVTLARCGMQYDLESTSPQDLWQENATNLARIEMYYKTLIIDEFPYCDDFEDDEGGWTVSGVLPSWEHGEPDNSTINEAASGDNAWVTDLDGDYNNDELSYLVSPEFDLTALVDPVIKFDQIRDLENGDDGVQFQVSIDSGYTYSVLGTSSSTNWYNNSSISALSSLGNGNGWTGTTTGWSSVQHSLSSYASDTSVFFRLVMAADGNTVDEGFGFDDLIVAESNDIAVTALWYPDSLCGLSATSVTASICNISVDAKTGFDIDIDTNGVTVSTTYSDTLDVCGCDTIELVNINSSAGGTWTLEVEVDNSGDVNAANDTLSGFMTMFGTPGVALISQGGNLCEGQVDTLTFSFQGVGPWNLSYSDGTNPQYIANITSNPFQTLVSQSGVYFPVGVTDASGCPADTSGITGIAPVTFFPAPIVNLGPDSSVCEGYTLDGGSGYASYQWSTGETSQSIVATQTNVFSVTVTDTIGCTGFDVADLNVFPAPVILLSDTILCEGSSFLFNAGGGGESYVWHDGSTGQVFQIDSIGTVSVTVTSFFGCEASETASITAVVPNPTPSISSTSSLAPVTLDAGNGYLSYFWNTNETTQTIDVAIAGTYTCTVTDLNGCQGFSDKKAKIWPNSIDKIEFNNQIAIFPNPVDQLLTVAFKSELTSDYDIYILDGAGRITKKFLNQSGKTQLLQVSDIASGNYLIRVQNEDLKLEEPFIIIH